MERICLCCLAESEQMYSVSVTLGAFLPEHTQELRIGEGPPMGAIKLNELYSTFIQLPLQVSLQISNEICSSCATVLKDFYLFRERAHRSFEELQTKADIAKIISHLEHSSVGSVCPERLIEDFEEEYEPMLLEPPPPSAPEAANSDPSGGPFRCTVCQKMFKMRKLLLRHEEVHRSTDQRPSRYHCQFCEKHFRTQKGCSTHELKAHRRPSLKKGLANSHENDGTRCRLIKKRVEHKCLICESHFSTARLLKEHNATMHPLQANRFPCDLCTKTFTRKSSLNVHKMVLHAGIRQHSCHICARSFGKEDSLKTHLELHTGKTHRCKLCSKAFVKASFLRKHLEQHESEEAGRRYVCRVCSKAFTTKSHLSDHELIHSDERPHRCNVCGSCFRQRQQLKIHSYQHFGKPLRCSECNAEFAARARLQAHIDSKHRQPPSTGQIPALQAPKPAPAVVEPDFGDKVVNEDILNEICHQIGSNPIMLQNIDADGVNLICNNSGPIAFLGEDVNHLLPETMNQCL